MQTGEAEDDILQVSFLDYSNRKQRGLDVAGPTMPQNRAGLVKLFDHNQVTY